MAADPSTTSLTEADQQLLEVLALRVRVLSMQQVARTWCAHNANPPKRAGRWTQRLEKAGLVECYTVMVRPEVPATAPLAVWQPGQRVPRLHRVVRAVAKRSECEAVATPVVMATESAGRSLGGRGGRSPRTSEQTHDLQLAAVYLAMRKEMPMRSRSWVHEDILVQRGYPAGQKLPDAIVTDGRSKTVIECCGESYDVTDLMAHHTYCDQHGYGYELW